MAKKKKPQFQYPDETFTSGPLTAARFGQNILYKANWPEGTFGEFQNNLVERYPKVIREIDTLVSEIAALVAELPSEELLVRAWYEMAARHINLEAEADIGNDEIISLRMLDYVQSIIAAIPPAPNQRQEVTEEEWNTLRDKIGALFEMVNRTYQHCRIAKNKAEDLNFNISLEEFRYKAQIYWCNIRGKRYQVHEPAYLQCLFLPHSDVLEELFGISGSQFVEEIANIWHELSFGIRDVFEAMLEFDKDIFQEIEKKMSVGPNCSKQDLQKIIDEIVRENNWENRRDAVLGRFYGTNLFDVQKTTKLPEKLLAELTWSPGEETDFFTEGEFRGWPLRIWPVFKRPFIRLNNRYYCFDLYSLLDNIYRVMERIVIRLKPDYRETWNSIQKRLSENLPFEYFERLLPGAEILKSVYYRGQTDAGTTGWCEADGLLIYDDHLFVIEAKGGAFTYTSPATDIQGWLKSLDNLVLKPATQGSRFLKYLSSATNVPLFDNKHKQIGDLSKSNFRHITVCTVTLDPFTEIAAQVQHLHGIGVDVGTEPVWSMSVDDLQVYADVFEDPLIFLHYVEQRMCAFQTEAVLCEDELEHLALYIKHNHYSNYVEKMQGISGAEIHFLGYKADLDKFFTERLSDPNAPCPLRQQIPTRVLEIIQFLSRSSMSGRSALASYLLDLNGEWREYISSYIDEELVRQPTTLQAKPCSTHGTAKLTMFCWRDGCDVRNAKLALDHTRAVLLVTNEPRRFLLELTFTDNCLLKDVSWQWVDVSGISRDELHRLQADAEWLRQQRVDQVKSMRKIGRNELCPCGSGKKYKKCCQGR